MPRNNRSSRPDFLKYFLSKTDRVSANGGNRVDPLTGKLIKHPKNYKKKAKNRRLAQLKKEQKLRSK